MTASSLGGDVAPPPSLETPLGRIVGKMVAPEVERYGGIPYALPPLGERRFARAELNENPWTGPHLDAQRPGPPCIQNPIGDPRTAESESPGPSEDCLMLNIWKPKTASNTSKVPVMVYLFGGGLCAGFAGNEYYHGSKLAADFNVVVVSVSYRLGALGFAVGSDPARPGTGGMNGLYDNVVALQWLQKYVAAFGGDANDITMFGQSSGGYSVCTLSIMPAAKGLFRRSALMSGPCFGGPPGRGWGPGPAEKGRNATAELLASFNVTSLQGLRSVPAEKIQWPAAYMNDLDKAPYFSGYFEDESLVPDRTESLWQAGKINPEEVLVQFTSKDGTSAFYGTAPTLGLISPDKNGSTVAVYAEKLKAAWGRDAEAIMKQYPLDSYTSASSAFVQADADAYVICPSRRLARHAAAAGRSVFVSEFAHFQPNPTEPIGCSGYGPQGCQGLGCDNGVELDVVPAHFGPSSAQWASHGADPKFVFGTERGPDGLGPPNNVTLCTFNREEASLRDVLMSYWVSFAKYGDPNKAAYPGSLYWPKVNASLLGSGKADILRMRFAVEATDGVATGLQTGVNDANCDFWDSLYPAQPEAESIVVV